MKAVKPYKQYWFLDETFNISGLNNQTVQLFEVKQNEAKDVYLQGQIDGLIVREPQKQQLLALGAVELLNSSVLSQRITHLVVARSDVHIKQEDQIVNLLKHFYKAHRYYQNNTKEAITTMAVRLQIFPHLLKDAFIGTQFIPEREALMRLSGAPSNVELQANQLSKVMIKKGMLGKIPEDFASKISTRILERVIYE